MARTSARCRASLRARSSASWTATSSARTTPSARWPSRCATAGAGSRSPSELRDEIAPKNIIMIGPTGVGKTEIARRLAKLAQAPFVKVEASKFTEVGYVGRDVESMIRDLVEAAIALVRDEETEKVRARARELAEDRLLRAARRARAASVRAARSASPRRRLRRPRLGEAEREKLRAQLRAGTLDDQYVEIEVGRRAAPPSCATSAGRGWRRSASTSQDLFKNMPGIAASTRKRQGEGARGARAPRAGGGGRS